MAISARSVKLSFFLYNLGDHKEITRKHNEIIGKTSGVHIGGPDSSFCFSYLTSGKTTETQRILL